MEMIFNKEINEYFEQLKIKIYINGHDKSAKRFINLNKFYNFIDLEIKKWGICKAQSLIANRSRLDDIKTQIINTYNQQNNNINFAKHTLDSLKTKIEQGTIVFSESSVGQFLLELDSINIKRSEGAFNFLFKDLGSFTKKMNDKEFFIGVLEAFHFQNIDEVIKRKYNAERKNIDSFISKGQDFTNNLEQEYNKVSQEINKWKNETIISLENRINKSEKDLSDLNEKWESNFTDTKELYENVLKLKGPAQYWKNLNRKYEKDGRNWKIWAIGLSIIMIIVLTCLLFNISSWIKSDEFGAKNIRATIIFTIIVSIGFYLIRFFIKLSLSAYHLARDALERHQLTYVYLALIKKEAVNENDQAIILQALFNRSDTGLIKNESKNEQSMMPFIQKIISNQ